MNRLLPPCRLRPQGGLLEIEKAYRNFIAASPAVQAMWDEVTLLLVGGWVGGWARCWVGGPVVGPCLVDVWKAGVCAYAHVRMSMHIGFKRVKWCAACNA